ncbi:hypothetical protein E2562_024291 [Oryza meyeriana var. granulata]|uniref:Uncharacterized protein n=1 Tax=Oryza meyeriana var. granulata TaxID=110450 RepID=A0A6G1C8G4_9ORYZ|nr:hypothetical protein E2562_024291 [Oryza meyeriana var. granulata]
MASTATSAFLEAVMGKLFIVLDKEDNKHKALEQENLVPPAGVPHDCSRHGRPAPFHGEERRRTAVARLQAEEMLDLEHDICTTEPRS